MKKAATKLHEKHLLPWDGSALGVDIQGSESHSGACTKSGSSCPRVGEALEKLPLN